MISHHEEVAPHGVGSTEMISQRELRAGLTDDKPSELEAFLASRCVPHDGMNLFVLGRPHRRRLGSRVPGTECLAPAGLGSR